MSKPLGQINIFAVPRSGGTILNLFLREFVCDKCSLIHPQMLADKSKNANDYGHNNLFLIRHPFGIYGSMLHVDSIDKRERLIKVQNNNAKMKLNELVNRLSFYYDFLDNNLDNGILIKYESYFNNFNFLREFIFKNYNVEITDDEFYNFQNDFNAESIAQDMINESKKRKDFRPFHVSSGKGNNEANLKLIPKDLRNESIESLQPFLDKMEYESFNLSNISDENNYSLDNEYSNAG